MQLWNTFYYFPLQSDYSSDANDTAIFDLHGNVIAMVPSRFVSELCVEGSGRLSDGRVVNYAGSCSYGPVCLTGGQMCYSVLDRSRYPWGVGVHSRPLVPLRSIAVDPSVISVGSTVFIQQFAGMRIPSIDGIGGFTHDGCFVADDQGGWIQGNHIDIFAGTHAMYLALEHVLPTHSNLTATIGGCRAGASGMTLGGGLIMAGVGILGGYLIYEGLWGKHA